MVQFVLVCQYLGLYHFGDDPNAYSFGDFLGLVVQLVQVFFCYLSRIFIVLVLPTSLGLYFVYLWRHLIFIFPISEFLNKFWFLLVPIQARLHSGWLWNFCLCYGFSFLLIMAFLTIRFVCPIELFCPFRALASLSSFAFLGTLASLRTLTNCGFNFGFFPLNLLVYIILPLSLFYFPKV